SALVEVKRGAASSSGAREGNWRGRASHLVSHYAPKSLVPLASRPSLVAADAVALNQRLGRDRGGDGSSAARLAPLASRLSGAARVLRHPTPVQGHCGTLAQASATYVQKSGERSVCASLAQPAIVQVRPPFVLRRRWSPCA